ncbi:MAG: molybdenum cofactor biosynthesis protein B [Robiginitomaculum sp.]|nr:MAG: molybdenum cofactor biosynthesis protein B [Robiginitomaculum sp.]
MHGINKSLSFTPVNIAVLIVSDTRTMATDTSGNLLSTRITMAGHTLADRKIIKDSVEDIQTIVKAWSDDPNIDAIITSGGTGLTGRDVTPEALTPLFDKTIEGFSHVFHMVSYQSVGVSTMQSRAIAGICNGTFIFALPGSNGAVKDGWDKVISLQLDSRHRPCNLVELMPRLMEK